MIIIHRLSKLKSKISKSYEIQKKELQFVLPKCPPLRMREKLASMDVESRQAMATSRLSLQAQE
jgi:hypothetical protein